MVRLVKAGFKEKTIITIINNRPSDFKLDTGQLISLKRNGVSENIILAMLSSQMGPSSLTEDEWGSDPFFKDLEAAVTAGLAAESGREQAFSARVGSSQSSTRSRGGHGGNQNEGTVSGSATVRIIKPPTEGGSSAPPSSRRHRRLNNEGVIRLVEAGFSEGTIIKRIEESPVDFDLSPAKLDELHKQGSPTPSSPP